MPADPNFPREGIRIEPPVGLPVGWEALQKQYLTGTKAGDFYVRFQTAKHRGVLTVKKAIELDAQDRGLDPAERLRLYDEMKAQIKAEQETERQLHGRVEGEMKERAILAFESAFGKLEGFVIPEMPGWSYSVKWQESCAQTRVDYFSPEGKSHGTVMQVIVALGVRMLHGEAESIRRLVEEGRQAAIRKYGTLDLSYNPLRRTADGTTLRDAADNNIELLREAEAGGINQDAEAMQAVEAKKLERASGKRKRVAWEKMTPTPESYVETESLSVVRATSSEELVNAGASADMIAASDAILLLLLRRGFPQGLELVAVTDRSAEPSEERQTVLGLYYRMQLRDDQARPRYQWVGLCTGAASGLACRKMYIYWSPSPGRWEIGPGEPTACHAYLSSDAPSPTDAPAPWHALRGDWRQAPLRA